MFDKEFVKVLAQAIVAEMAGSDSVAPHLLTFDQAAAYTGLTKVALKCKALDNQIPRVRIDNRYRFDKRDLDAWIEEHKR